MCVGERASQVVVGNKAIQSRRTTRTKTKLWPFSSLLEVSTTTATTTNTTSHFYSTVKLAFFFPPTTLTKVAALVSYQ